MKIEYDPEVDALYVRLSDARIVDSEAVRPGVILDFDEAGHVTGVEILGVSKRDHADSPLKEAA